MIVEAAGGNKNLLIFYQILIYYLKYIKRGKQSGL